MKLIYYVLFFYQTINYYGDDSNILENSIKLMIDKIGNVFVLMLKPENLTRIIILSISIFFLFKYNFYLANKRYDVIINFLDNFDKKKDQQAFKTIYELYDPHNKYSNNIKKNKIFKLLLEINMQNNIFIPTNN